MRFGTQEAVDGGPGQADEVRVRTELRDSVLVVVIDNTPVNALSGEVRKGLQVALDRVDADTQIEALLLVGAGRHFIGGADIREFGKDRVEPTVSELCSRIENCSKPVIAAIRGAAMGGGLEVAVGAHYRLATPSAVLALPEVRLGLLPGSGGTQRVTRLVGIPTALEMMLSGRSLSATEALEFGLVDRVTEGDDVLSEGLAYARELLASGANPRRSCDAVNSSASAEVAQAAIDEARARVRRGSPHLLSPHLIVDAVEASLTLPFVDALALERSFFKQCEQSPQRAGLVHAFFAEREVVRIAEAAAQSRPLGAAGVVGGGTMGATIAVALLDAGLSVTMIERDDASLERGQAAVERVLIGRVAKGRMSEGAKADVMKQFSGETDYDALKTVDLVIEAVFEDMAVKQKVFSELDRVCRSGAVLATNTSYLDIDSLAASISRPQDVIGLHFFAPAHIMKLLEVVVPAKAESDVVATAFTLAKMMGKVPVRAGVCDGFIGNRILSVYRRAAEYMIEDGATPYQIDSALREFGYPMGPFQVSDLSGGDIGLATRKRQAATRDPAMRYVHVADRIAERGWYGQKTGRGWYLYPDETRVGQPDPEVLEIIAAERRAAGIEQPRLFTDEEIVRRYVAAMVNEGAKVVADGIALRPLDVDITFMHGFGFPRFRGGPMKYADTVGLDRILRDLEEFALDDPGFWRPAPLLCDLVAQGLNFESLNTRR
ncbi:3-hydroxyacyl-CoA dehydrogenase NAD-binding domain-containing protein [Rhodococcus qingshengii]|uniref:3-hydroxyacyl-CoA dehydrogenase n=1 Tax=Rhodococcus qingshengii TaxID=334542 RepID=A0A2A5J105_RHOSG|nr:3-hydroxyacyl-CoA dehydrogenase NAD-binding domain-containing protein [Rhodococcus qingshengii]PCK23042.1 3-hydroxyacyl-CoA dehydrogenase [Rhodococcus qingshengii]